jgi:sulfur-carrier protein
MLPAMQLAAATGERQLPCSRVVVTHGARKLASLQPRMLRFEATMGAAPTITIHVPGPLRVYCAGAAQLTIAAPTVRAALAVIEQSQFALYRNVCDETGKVRQHLNVFVNSDNVRDLDGMDTLLKAGDLVTILPAVSGG